MIPISEVYNQSKKIDGINTVVDYVIKNIHSYTEDIRYEYEYHLFYWSFKDTNNQSCLLSAKPIGSSRVYSFISQTGLRLDAVSRDVLLEALKKYSTTLPKKKSDKKYDDIFKYCEEILSNNPNITGVNLYYNLKNKFSV